MSRYIYILMYADEATAIADPVASQWYVPGHTQRGHWVPGFWNINGAAPIGFNGPPPDNTPYDGFWLMHSTLYEDSVLDADAQMQVSYDPDVYGPTSVYINNLGDLSQYYITAVYAGDTGPFPNNDPNA